MVRRRLTAWLDQKVGTRAAPVRHQLREPAVLEQWAATLRTPSMQRKHELNTGHEVFGQWPVDSLFQCLFLTFCVFCQKSA